MNPVLLLIQIEEIVDKVKIYSEGLVDNKNIFLVKPTEKLCETDLFAKKQYYYNGDCYAFVLPDCLRESGVLEITFSFYDKTDIFIHHEGQFLSPCLLYTSPSPRDS